MGVDLTFAIGDMRDKRWFLAWERVMAGQDRDQGFYDKVSALKSKRLPKTCFFQWYGDKGCERRTTDRYGDPLRYCLASEFVKIPAEGLSVKNRAVLLFLQSLAPGTWVVLWWH